MNRNQFNSVWESKPELAKLLYAEYPKYGSNVWDRFPQFKRNKISREAIEKKASRLKIKFDTTLNHQLSLEQNADFFKGKKYVCKFGHIINVGTGKCLEANHPPHINLNTAKIGIFDIEATRLEANWGHMLSWVVKTLGKKEIHIGRITRKDLLNLTFDKRITQELIACLDSYDVLISWYGGGYDNPFARTRALKHNMQYFPFGTKASWDLWQVSKHKLRMSSNSLDSVAELLGIKGKTHLSPYIWMCAGVGDPKSLDYVVQHNIEDVLVTEKVHNRLGGIWNKTKTSI